MNIQKHLKSTRFEYSSFEIPLTFDSVKDVGNNNDDDDDNGASSKIIQPHQFESYIICFLSAAELLVVICQFGQFNRMKE